MSTVTENALESYVVSSVQQTRNRKELPEPENGNL